MDPIAAGLMLCVAGYIAYRAFRPRDKATAILRSIARLHGGRFDKHGTLLLTVDGFAIEVRALLPSDVNNKLRGETYWRIKVPPPGTTTFAIYPEGFKSHASKVLGTREVNLQLLPGFDAAFMVIADDPSALYRVWTRERCEDMLVTFATGTLRSLGDAIELDSPSDPTIVKVKRGIDFLVSLARTDVYGMAALRALPDATPTAEGYVEIAGPGAIRIGPHRRDHSMVTRASASVEIDPARTPPPTLGAASLACANGETTIEWLEIEENPARLTAAIEFLRSLAVAPSEGVFR